MLKRKLINTISSERLGNFDVLLINLWLKGVIKTSQRVLYRKIIPFGGLGTYRWIKYIKSHPDIKIKIIPSEVDDLTNIENFKPKFMDTIKNICSTKFGTRLCYKYLNHEHIQSLKKYTETTIDKLCYQYFHDSIFTDYQHRFVYWLNNLENNYNSNTKLFINGYHLWNQDSDYSMGPKMSGKFGKPLYLGMGSAYLERELLLLPGILPDNIDKTKYIISKRFIKLFNSYLNKLEISGLANNKIKIENISKYFGKTKLEEKYEDMYSVINTRHEKGFIKIGGNLVVPLIYAPKTILSKNIKYLTININVFDYVIFIPKSTFNYNMTY